MANVLALFLAGLALFFSGIAGIRTNLQQLTGRRFRALLTRGTQHAALAGLWGFVFGAMTQSATAVAFILAGLISAGSLPVSRALTIVGWANVGTAVLVFLAAININVAVLYLIGIAGLAITFDVTPKLKPAFAALLSVGLLFFGLNLMKQAFAPLPGFAWFDTVAEFARSSDVAAAAFGLVLRTVVQSASAVTVLAVTLSHAGLMSDTQVIMMIFGTSVGVALSSYLLSADLSGIPRQVVLFQGAINGVSGLVCIALVLVEKATGWPLLLSFIRAVPATPNARFSLSFLVLMLGVAAVAHATARWAPGWLNRWSPPTPEQDLSRPQHLLDEALRDPDTALDLAEREQQSLLAGMPAYFQAARDRRAGDAPAVDPDVRHRAFATVVGALEEYCATLADQNLSRATSTRLLALERRIGLLQGLDDSLHRFAMGVEGPSRDGQSARLTDTLIEGADTVLLTAIEAWRTHDPEEMGMLLAITEDRGEMMEHLRRSYADDEADSAHKERAGLFYLTSIFERIIWLLRQIGLSLRDSARDDA